VTTGAVTWLIAMVLVMRFLDIGVGTIASRLWRVLFGLFGMALAVEMVRSWGGADAPPVVRLALSIMAGAASYVVFVLGAWVIAGRPDGAESHVANTAGIVLRRFMRSAAIDTAVDSR